MSFRGAVSSRLGAKRYDIPLFLLENGSTLYVYMATSNEEGICALGFCTIREDTKEVIDYFHAANFPEVRVFVAGTHMQLMHDINEGYFRLRWPNPYLITFNNQNFAQLDTQRQHSVRKF